MSDDEFKLVPKDYFYKFVKDNKLKRINGDSMHSFYYINNNDEKIAYEESSSYSMNIIYKIKNDLCNFETSLLMINILNNI